MPSRRRTPLYPADADVAPEPPDEGELIAESSVPPPVITVGSDVTAPLIRVGGYALTGQFVVQGCIEFDWLGAASWTASQGGWVSGALTLAFAAILNVGEKLKGRRLLGAPPVAV